MKSSTNAPSGVIACARTPAGPRVTSAAVISGMNFCNSRTASAGKNEWVTSFNPALLKINNY